MTAATLAAAFVILLGGGFGVWWAFLRNGESPTVSAGDSGDTGGSGDAQGNAGGDAPAEESYVLDGAAAWQEPFSGDPEADYGYGAWLSEDAVVRVSPAAVTAYSRESGEQVWQAPVEGNTRICGMSEDTSEGLGIIALAGQAQSEYSPDPAWICTDVAAVDLATGEVRWKSQLPAADPFTAGSDVPHLVPVGDAVAVEYDDHYSAFTLADGTARWSKLDGLRVDPDDTCVTNGVRATADASALVALWSCSHYENGDRSMLVRVDPASGAVTRQWEHVPVGDPGLSELVSAEPVAVVNPSDPVGGTEGAIVVFGADGDVASTIPTAGEWGDLKLLTLRSSPPHSTASPSSAPVLAADGLLVGTTVPVQTSEVRSSSEVVVFDLAAGEVRWHRALSENAEAVPVQVDGDRLIAITAGVIDEPSQVYSLDLADGAPTPLSPGLSDADGEPLFGVPLYADMLWADDQLYFSSHQPGPSTPETALYGVR